MGAGGEGPYNPSPMDRWPALRDFDRAFHCETLCGVDEVGRGPLAGPVVAAAVILRPDAHLPGLNDSKQLTAAQREALFAPVCRAAHAIGISWIDPETIDRINILRAALLAMHRAIGRLRVRPALVLVDGNQPLREWDGEQRCVIQGDGQSASIAAAAIVAKVMRDRYMCCLDARDPRYGFAAHKGYYAPQHLAALVAHAPCIHHRRSFHVKALED